VQSPVNSLCKGTDMWSSNNESTETVKGCRCSHASDCVNLLQHCQIQWGIDSIFRTLQTFANNLSDTMRTYDKIFRYQTIRNISDIFDNLRHILASSICFWRCYINISITILDIIYRPVFYLKLNSTQLNFISLSVSHRKHITSPLRSQQINAIYRFVTMVYSY
jgi:hypothetical protein